MNGDNDSCRCSGQSLLSEACLMSALPILDSIREPSDLRALTVPELQQLAGEIRERIFQAVSTNGGHLASNLGVVELTIALHYVYEFGPYPKGPDRLLFDVGHQCYPHKMLTGRAGQFDRLRKKGSVSGFPSPEESPYDLFSVGHAGTAISTAVVARPAWRRAMPIACAAMVGGLLIGAAAWSVRPAPSHELPNARPDSHLR